MMTPNYGRKYITIVVDVKLYLAFFWISDQKGGWSRKGKDRYLLLVHRDTLERLKRGESAEQIGRSWAASLEEFRRIRERALIYK
jgi:hypothetical protein